MTQINLIVQVLGSCTQGGLPLFYYIFNGIKQSFIQIDTKNHSS